MKLMRNKLFTISILMLCIVSILSIPSVNAVTYYYLDISSNPVEGGYTDPVTGEHEYESEEYVTITAYPYDGYEFYGWLVDGTIPVYNNPWSFNIDHNTTAIATFVEENVTLTIQSRDNGYTNPSAGEYTYDRGSNVSITAYPDEGYNLYNWEVNGGIDQGLVGVNPLEFAIDIDLVIAPIFTDLNWFYVDLLENGNGTANLNWGTYFVFDTDPYFTVWGLPDDGYELDYWQINGTIERTENPVSIFINGNSTVQPYFTAIGEVPFSHTIITYISPFIIVGVLGMAFSQIGEKLGGHAIGGFLIGGSMGLLVCANSGLIAVWFVTAIFMCGIIGIYFWAKGG